MTAPSGAFRMHVDETGLAEVVFDRPGSSVNTFGPAVMEELEALLDELARDARISVAMLASGKEKGFAAGADIAEIAAVTDPEDARLKVVRGQKVFGRLAALPFPTLAVIHGACLGGGLEMALACRHRIAALDAELGLPEVRLGFIPGWGGTQRLPRLIGPAAAVDLICSGRRIDGDEALRLGLVDHTVPARELDGGGPAGDASSGVDRAGRGGRGGRAGSACGGRLRRLALEDNPVGRKALFAAARRSVQAKAGLHYRAPVRALQAIEEGLEGSLEAGLALEARIASDLIVSPASKNLIHVFELFEGVAKSPWAQAPPDERQIERAAVIGAGVMGGGIAQLLAEAGLPVRLKDLETRRVAEGLRAARAVFERRRGKRKMDQRALRRATNLISGTTTHAGLGRVDLAIEAIVEDVEAKRKLFAELDARVPQHALLCTNTSSLRVADVAAGVRDPSRVAGLHFFNPVDRMPLVEVVHAKETSDETVGALYRLALRLRKKPVVVADAPGFLVNRLLMPYLNEAVHLFSEGVAAEAVDGVMTGFGMPVGPLALLDDIGLDVAAKVGHVLSEAFPERLQPAPLIDALPATGRLGRKGGRGFYLYEGGERRGADAALRRELAGDGASGVTKDAGRQAGCPDAVEIEHRLIYPMVNEAAICLSEAVVGSAAEVDLAMLAGTGFPPFRGGLLRHADAVGVGVVITGLERLSASASPWYAPSIALRAVAAEGGFYTRFPPERAAARRTAPVEEGRG